MFNSRNSKELIKKFKSKKIAVVGLGGLGSNIATMLIRSGLEEIYIYDFDSVEISNLNRQNYYLEHIGMKKSYALSKLLKNINSNIKVYAFDVFLNESNFDNYLDNIDIIAEAFDNPEMKAKVVSWALKNNKTIVSASGMAGFGESNEIVTKKIKENFYISGDFKNDFKEFSEMLSPRVTLVASHQANAIINIVLNS